MCRSLASHVCSAITAGASPASPSEDFFSRHLHRLLARVRLKVPDPQLPSHQHCHRPHRPRRPHRRPCSAAAAQTEVVPPPCRRGIKRRVSVGARLAADSPAPTIESYKSFREKKEVCFLVFAVLLLVVELERDPERDEDRQHTTPEQCMSPPTTAPALSRAVLTSTDHLTARAIISHRSSHPLHADRSPRRLPL